MDEGVGPERPAKGSPESAAEFRAMLTEAGQTLHGLAKLMRRCGDDRQTATILRKIQRIAAGEARVSGEMRVILHFLRRGKRRDDAREADEAHSPIGTDQTAGSRL